jgi:hypothetical protein
MSTAQPFPAGGYRFIAHQFQYSGGVAAEPGFRIERARFTRPVPLAEGFDAIETYLGGIGRSPTAFCACELRSPAQFTDAGFVAFNRHYIERLAAWGIFRDEFNPVARSNVCPEIDPPHRRFTPSATPCRAKTARRRALLPPEAAKRARAALAMTGASFGAPTSRRRRCARRRASCSGRMVALGFGDLPNRPQRRLRLDPRLQIYVAEKTTANLIVTAHRHPHPLL